MNADVGSRHISYNFGRDPVKRIAVPRRDVDRATLGVEVDCDGLADLLARAGN